LSLSKIQRHWAVFVSGSGSTLQALLDQPELISVKLVVTNKKKCAAILKARRYGISVLYLKPGMSFQELSEQLLKKRITAIFLAGFMKIIPVDFLKDWEGRIFNIHPSMLPAYKGLQAFERALEDGAATGASIHHVIEGVDEGELVLQKQATDQPEKWSPADNMLLLRKTEQYLLRSFVIKGVPLV